VAFKSYVNTPKNDAHQAAMDAIKAEIAAEMDFELLDREVAYALPADELGPYMEKSAVVNEQAEARIGEVMDAAPPVDVADFVDHIDYLVNLIGIEHVGISSDFDGGGGVYGWNSAAETFNVTLELVRRGYTEDEIGMMWSGNLLRVLDDVQRIAAEIQAEEG